MPPTPEEILSLAPEAADDLLDRLEREVPVSPRLVKLPARPFSEAVVFGDTHGDWRSTQRVVAAFLAEPGDRMLIGLGDYVDRSPEDCGYGSVANALYLLGLASRYPERVLLIKGNHELHRLVGVLPHDLAEEVDQLWGPEEERYHRIVALLERGPYAAVSPSGVYFAHGGFPRTAPSARWESLFDGAEDELVLDVAWGECGASRARRGVVPPFSEDDLARFLKLSGTRLFLRGHDPDLTGRWVFGARCLTLHTSRLYERYGGVLFARVPLDRAVDAAKSVAIERLDETPV
ncbi:MAG TPA: metallophosphoesterase family protein [Thermoplasmata archaeon]|nr:metallophosphoesterase family protein [Thermoplasmata archaeon]